MNVEMLFTAAGQGGEMRASLSGDGDVEAGGTRVSGAS